MVRAHLLLCVHGLGGSPQDFHCLSQSISNYFKAQSTPSSPKENKETDDDDAVQMNILSLQSNKKKLTHMGIETMGKNMASEVREWLEQWIKTNCDAEDDYIYEDKKPPKLRHKVILSVLCHSLGGLVARAGIKEMFFGSHRDFFHATVICGSFTTMCAPHLGTRHPGGGKHVSMIGKALFRTGARWACKNLMGKTGLELYLKDAPKLEDTMLFKMTLPDSDFMKALRMFHFHTLIASTRHDHIVPFCSASIRSHNPHRKPPKSRPSKCKVASYSGFDDYRDEFEKILNFLGHTSSVNETVTPFMAKGTRHNPFYGKKQSSGWYRDNLRHSKFDPQMLTNLQTIPWRRVSLEFQLPSFLNHTNAHSLCLGSWFTGSREDMTPAGIEAVRLIMMLMYMDHRFLVEKHYGLSDLVDSNLLELSGFETPCSDEELLEERRSHRHTQNMQAMDFLVRVPEHPMEDTEGVILRDASSSSDVDEFVGAVSRRGEGSPESMRLHFSSSLCSQSV